MESIEQQRVTQSFAFKLSTKFLLPVLFFSILLPVFLHNSKFQFSTFTVHPFSYNNDKNYMFLLCNGILVLIVKNAGLMGAKKNREYQSELQESPGVKALVAEEKGSVQAVQEEQHLEDKSLTIVEEAEFSGLMIIEEEFKEQRNEIANIDEDEEDGFGLLTTEELNKKCDEFIRKMKEGIKFEAQALITV